MFNSFSTPWTVACQAPLSTGFSRQACWSGLSFPPPGDPPDPGTEPMSPALAGRFFYHWATWEALVEVYCFLKNCFIILWFSAYKWCAGKNSLRPMAAMFHPINRTPVSGTKGQLRSYGVANILWKEIMWLDLWSDRWRSRFIHFIFTFHLFLKFHTFFLI